jgi:hypothetical protein
VVLSGTAPGDIAPSVWEDAAMRAEVEIEFDAPPHVREVLSRLGRTEDVRFSPDNRRLALACFELNAIVLADVEITQPPGRPAIRVSDVSMFTSTYLKRPHGVEFVDDERILVANRYGKLVMFRLPERSSTESAAPIPLERPDDLGFELLKSPGSVRIARAADGMIEVVVCDNDRSRVTRHELGDDPLRVTNNEVLVRRLLEFPDGVAVSADHQWVAVSNHHAHVVLVHRWTPALSERSEPACILRGTMYPHGVHFSADGRHLLVADAGRPHVQLYTRPGDEWHGVAYPAASVRAMSDEVYARGRDHESRGPKGLDIDGTGRVLALTYEKRPIALLDLCSVLERSAEPNKDDSGRMTYEIEVLDDARARLDQRTATLLGARSFRVTKPLRTVHAAFTKKRR